MGSPNTIDICVNCGEPVIQWNNTGSWEHLESASTNQAFAQAQHSNTKNGISVTNCKLPHVLAKDKVTAGLPSTQKTAVKRT